MNKFIKNIIKEKKTCVFVSPHLDDAILSCGGLISHLSKKTEVVVVNVFTDGGKSPYSLSVKKFLKSCGYNSSKELFEARVKEDSEVFSVLKITPINLGITDGLFRKKRNLSALMKHLGKFLPEVSYVYPTYFHIVKGRISGWDKRLLNDISENLKGIIKQDFVVFCPFGVGRHVDHMIAREVCRMNFRNVIYWEDFPYSLNNSVDMNFIKENGLERLGYDANWTQKSALIKGYKTQVKGLFPDGYIPKVKEYYFTKF